MVFSSLQFIYFFLPLAIIFYYIVDRKFKNTVLLIISLLFYAWGEPKFVLVLIFMCLFNWAISLGIYKFYKLRKAFLSLAICADLGVLVVFKYMNFITTNISAFFEVKVTNIVLPIGISFFTFQILSYAIDVYRNPTLYVCKNPLDLMLYISFFPQLVAGPIVRYNSIIDQIKNRKESLEQIFGGGREIYNWIVKKNYRCK